MNEPLQLGRYSLLVKLASGGMASVYLARLNSEVGFGRTVAIKRIHPHLAGDPTLVSMFLDEARLAARIHHPNVVPTVDVVTHEGELFLVMEYVRGESLSALLRATTLTGTTAPVPVVASIAIGLLSGLQAAHEATDEDGRPLVIVHRDVSPHNVLVGVDGVARVLDFGIAKASVRLQTTREGQLKGKLAYMAPEQVAGAVTQRTDIYAAGVVLWEALTCRRLFMGATEAQLLHKVMESDIKPPSRHNAEIPPELDKVVLRALAKDPEARYASAREMAHDIDRALRPASAMSVAEWVTSMGGETLAERNRLVASLESSSPRPDRNSLASLDLERRSGPVPPPPASMPELEARTANSVVADTRTAAPLRGWVVGASIGLTLASAAAVWVFTRTPEPTITAIPPVGFAPPAPPTATPASAPASIPLPAAATPEPPPVAASSAARAADASAPAAPSARAPTRGVNATKAVNPPATTKPYDPLTDRARH